MKSPFDKKLQDDFSFIRFLHYPNTFEREEHEARLLMKILKD